MALSSPHNGLRAARTLTVSLSPFVSLLLGFLLLVSHTSASPIPDNNQQSSRPAAFFLAGDSTTAPFSSEGGGWGNGFLATLNPASASASRNFGHNHATTVSFVEGGDWANVKAAASAAKASGHDVYVTIQFGTNDMVPKWNITAADFQANLQRMAAEVVDQVGGTPILVTPLTKRLFDMSVHPPRVNDDLGGMQDRVFRAARQGEYPVIDLHGRSLDYVNAMGPGDQAVDAYDRVEGDYVHLNPRGSVVFGRLVADLIVETLPQTRPWISQDAAMSGDIRDGKLV